ncbi:PIN domain-containing protein [Rhodovulum sulfidophilum]|uniref:PIN domain-containing protein n=1 Tax=Rhodovulum visakhapatnamense TaxID=364297 RepID=A0A4R8FAY5_9RHOB|nr:PIN domain-containing protein [Rhodovulum visakhapatnamense]MBL3569355.1 PIN domain-containing protein [Rhodovulum visakhapatnamense]MBL3576712.1 PIN domain-containing protein [Rhodovulum visakhapatnamense]OLS44274.1 PIN domain-containing protein [Rhodovulum sulfidophilum]TDX22874.1 PIN domain-containing protein [Rhodovulum visakhapatnamense]
MKVLLDTCVLYPTVLREILLKVAGTGLFTPLWSARILEEWARAACKIGPTGEAQARAEIALLRGAWPGAEVAPKAGLEARLWLPDPDDVHVLAAAVAGGADAILTFNARDFPGHLLAAEGLVRAAPDGLLMDLWLADPGPVERAVAEVHAAAERMAGEPLALRALLKRARLPRLGKALG